MGFRHVQCLIFIMNLLVYSGNLAKEPEYSSHYISTFAASQASTQKSAVNINEEVQNSTQMPRPDPKLPTGMPKDDIISPIPTVPAINPSNPTTSTAPTESNPTTPMITPSSSSSPGLSWCIASQSASQTSMQVALDYACGYGGADCSQIQPGESCFNPDTVRNHASYAFNSYFLKNPIPTSCDFEGTAIITNIDPSTSTCIYPSTSTSYSVLNTTNPSGSTVFGSTPPASSGIDPFLRTLPLCLTFLGILMSVS